MLTIVNECVLEGRPERKQSFSTNRSTFSKKKHFQTLPLQRSTLTPRKMGLAHGQALGGPKRLPLKAANNSPYNALSSQGMGLAHGQALGGPRRLPLKAAAVTNVATSRAAARVAQQEFEGWQGAPDARTEDDHHHQHAHPLSPAVSTRERLSRLALL